MNDAHPSPPWTAAASGRWEELADRVIEGHGLSGEEALAILRSDDRELLEVLAAAYRVRYRWFGNRVHLNFLINAKSGLCGEDCGYCSQSRFSRAEIPMHDLLDPADVRGAEFTAFGLPIELGNIRFVDDRRVAVSSWRDKQASLLRAVDVERYIQVIIMSLMVVIVTSTLVRGRGQRAAL